jgi:hypothetical protein
MELNVHICASHGDTLSYSTYCHHLVYPSVTHSYISCVIFRVSLFIFSLLFNIVTSLCSTKLSFTFACFVSW